MQDTTTNLLRQPFVGITTAVFAGIVNFGTLLVIPLTFSTPAAQGQFMLAAILTVVVVGCHRYTIHLPHKTRIYLGTAPLYLMAVLLPPALALLAVGIGKTCGELVVRRQSGMYASDIAVQTGRWVLIAALGTWAIHLNVGAQLFSTAPLIVCALLLVTADIVSSPLLLTPISGERPIKVIVSVLHEAAPAEVSHYLVAILGTLAARQAAWSLILLVLPTTLVYLAFKSAKDMREATRQLLSSVVETTPDAIMVVDLDGRVTVGNLQSALLQGLTGADDLVDQRVLDHIVEQDRGRAEDDMRLTLETGHSRIGTYAVTRADGGVFQAELTWALALGRNGSPRAITLIERDVTQRKKAEQALARRALYDPLTELPNRELFGQRMDEALERGAVNQDFRFAVLQMDLNRFKQANDTFGHRCGDFILQEIGRRLRTALRDSDTVARLGGDEFAVILTKADEDGAHIVASRFQQAIKQPIAWENRQLDIGASIGIALFPQHGDSAETLLHRADLAMYEAKRNRRDFQVFVREEEDDRREINAA